MAKKAVVLDEREKAVLVEMDSKVEEYNSIGEEVLKLKELRDAKIEAINAAFEAKIQPKTERKAMLETELRTMFDQVQHKETKTQAKVELLAGNVIVKKADVKLSHDDKALLEAAHSNDSLKNYIKVKETESFDWSGLKEHLGINQGDSGYTIIDVDTGEIVSIEGLTVEEVPEQIQIK